MLQFLKRCSLFLFTGFVYYSKQTEDVTGHITFTILYFSNEEILQKIIIKYMHEIYEIKEI